METTSATFSGPSAGSVPFGSNSGRIRDINIYNSALSHQTHRPEPFSTVPFRRDRDFIDRGDLLEQISSRCSQPAGRVALVGLGGVGKSQLAIEYAHRVREQSAQIWVFWIHGSTTARVEEAYRAIATRLGLITAENRQANALELLQRWLENEENGEWVIVMDNADDTGVFFDSEPSETKPVASYLPQSHRGHILFTSRSEELASRLVEGYRNILRVGPMEKEEGMALFRTKRVGQDDLEEAAELLRVLDHIALAVSQAAAYINRAGRRGSAKRYLQTYHQNERSRTSLLNYNGGDLRRDTSAHNSVVVTWQILFEQIAQERPTAADLLSLMSCFHWQGIPEDVLRGIASSWTRQQDQDPNFEFNEDVILLSSYSLVASSAEGDMFDMHRLVQISTRTWLSAKEQSEHWEQVFLETMARDMPTGDFENWSKCQAFFPHAAAAGTAAPFNVTLQCDWATMLYKAAWYAWAIRQYAVAEDMARKSTELRERELPAEHIESLDSSSLLALVLECQGKYEAAEEMNRRALEGYEKALGKEHPDTLASVSNLGSVLSRLGKYDEAEAMHRRDLEGSEKVLGRDHPDTVASVSQLGSVLESQGKYNEAEAMHRQALKGREKALGRDHPYTLTSVYYLAYLFHQQHNYKTALDYYERACAGFKVKLSGLHPTTVACQKHRDLALQGK